MKTIKRKCKCGCGKITKPGNIFINGHNKSTSKHGLSGCKLYWVWASMKKRCCDSNNKQYQDYGGRDIRVCIRWQKSFKSFYNWCINNGYKEGLQIDRINNDEGYTLDNCRFTTPLKNTLNRRMNKNNKSGFIGVSYQKSRNKYVSFIGSQNRKHIGSFNTAKEASIARDSYILENDLDKLYQVGK